MADVSDYTDVILCLPSEDAERMLSEVNDFFRRQENGFGWLRMALDAAGHETFSPPIALGTVNRLCLEAFAEHLQRIRWPEGSYPQLFVREEHGERAYRFRYVFDWGKPWLVA